MYSKHKHLKSKIFDCDQHVRFEQTLRYWRFKGLDIVFTNGCFDIFHPGHADYLARAADLAKVLIVGLNTDRSVQHLKGPERPINSQEGRAIVLASLSFVDAVVLFNDKTPERIIEVVCPDILVKGGDYKPDEVAGADIVKQNNGMVNTLSLLEGYSTTSIIEKTKKIR